ncbi:MAG: putative DNA binding domain-containing protein [Victivallales bacterium]|nr:putative DNA binding domain-containing protein [Victivallales bacterium]
MTEQAKQELRELVQGGETLTVEFKGDWSGNKQTPNNPGLPDKDLTEALVALANTEGGCLLLGVEDDGAMTDVRPRHQDEKGLMALVTHRTIPFLSVNAILCELDGHTIMRIEVPKSRQLIATTEGVLLRRRLKADGKPEAVPFYPHEFMSRQSSFGDVDPSAIVIEEIAYNQLDGLQRLRLRQMIEAYHGDATLKELSDEELDLALQLVVMKNGDLHPTVAGLLILGTEKLLRQYLPTYEVAFQMLEGTEVRRNIFYRKPLLETFEAVSKEFSTLIREEELEVGLFRVPVPNYDERAFREAFVNSLTHRDYNLLGTVLVQIDDHGLTISNPGSFIDGVNIHNLLVVRPHSRNPLLADVIKRIGLAERTGRGIDRIYEGLLRYGRPAPDYSASDETSVSVYLNNAQADLAFMRMHITASDKPMPLDSLIILSSLLHEKQLSITELQAEVQKSEKIVHSEVEELVEQGLITPHGNGRGRTYMISAEMYAKAGNKAAFVRQAGFSKIQQEQMILSFIDAHESIKRGDVMELCHLSPDQSTRLLTAMRNKNLIQQQGTGKSAYYIRK